MKNLNRSKKGAVDDRHLAAAKSVEKFVLDDLWYDTGRELVEDERINGKSYSKTVLERAFLMLGYHQPPSRKYFRHCIGGFRGFDRLRIKKKMSRGVPAYFAYWLARWNEKGKIGRQEVVRLLTYRQRFIRGHPVSMSVFQIASEEDLEALLALEKSDREAQKDI